MADPPDHSPILSFEDARHLVESHAAKFRPRATETADLLDSCGHVLAEPVFADRDFPPFRRAARDGYALRSADLKQLPATLKVVGEIKAGTPLEQIPTLQPGQAAAIMTGAPAPEGADAVVMVEYTSQHGDQSSRFNRRSTLAPTSSRRVRKPNAAASCFLRECIWIMRPFPWPRR